MVRPRLVAAPPDGWMTADIPRPPIATSSGASWASWHAARASADDAALVGACAAAPVPGWVEDMRPPFEARTVALAGATAERIVGSPVELRADGEQLAVHPVGDQAKTVGIARTFLGFDGESAHACFVVCARRGSNGPLPATCHDVVEQARLEASAPPPSPGLALATIAWAVHHPRPAAIGLGSAAALVAMIAVATRRKPRTRS